MLYIYIYVYALFSLYLIDFIIYVRDEHEALHCILENNIVAKMLHCRLFPCTLFWQLSIVI